eukprot:632722-Amphidinium_carterae.1
MVEWQCLIACQKPLKSHKPNKANLPNIALGLFLPWTAQQSICKVDDCLEFDFCVCRGVVTQSSCLAVNSTLESTGQVHCVAGRRITFSVCFAAFSFSLHYDKPAIAYMISGILLVTHTQNFHPSSL